MRKQIIAGELKVGDVIDDSSYPEGMIKVKKLYPQTLSYGNGCKILTMQGEYITGAYKRKPREMMMGHYASIYINEITCVSIK